MSKEVLKAARTKIRVLRVQNKRLEAKVTKLAADLKAAKERIQSKLISPDQSKPARQIGKDPAQIGKSKEQIQCEERAVLAEGAKLRRLLKTGHVRSKLTCLTDVALESTSPVTRRDRYKPLSETTNDGFEVSLGTVPYDVVCKAKYGLINFINARSSLFGIKNVLP